MAVTNDFVSQVLKLSDPQGALLWIAGFPRPVAPTEPAGRSEEAVRLVAPLRPYTIGATGTIARANPGDRAEREVFLSIVSYGPGLTRIHASLDASAPLPTSDMIAPGAALEPVALEIAEAAVPQLGGCRSLVLRGAGGETVAAFRLELPRQDHWSDLIPGPDEFLDGFVAGIGGEPVRLYGYNQFVPPMRDSVGLGFLETNGTITRAVFSLHADAHESFAGTGERFLELDLAGRTLDLVNQDALGTNTPRAYKNVPFYLSSAGYGLFVHSSVRMTASLKGVSSRAVVWALEDDEVDLFVMAGGEPERILFRYRTLTGFPPQVPLWSYGTWMSRMTYFSADEIKAIASRLRGEQYPCDVIHIDTGWFAKDWVCEWRFSEERFPDPAGFMAELRDGGFRVSLWQNPNIGAGNRLLDDAVARGFIPRPPARAGASGSDFAAAELTGQIDFTNPEAVSWYRGMLRDLFDQGAAAIKTDFGEEIRTDVEYHGMEAARLQNLYGLLYQRAAWEQTRESTGEPIVWARAGWAGCQRYPVHWGGDAEATWDGLAGSLRGGLHLGLSGFGYWSHDVPGFHGTPDFMNTRPDPELYVRWTQFGVLSSHLRYHGTYPREPWHYDEVSATVREWLKLRYALVPYLLREAEAMGETGMPLLRALLLHHPDDPRSWSTDDEYFLGSDLLVAPIMGPGGSREVYLPAGRWVDFFSGEVFEGPVRLRDRSWPLEHLPLYARAGARIPVYPQEVQCTDEIDLTRAVELVFDDMYGGLADSGLGYVRL